MKLTHKVLIALISVALYQLIEAEWFRLGLPALLIITFGIPHGATDHLADNMASTGKFSTSVSIKFLVKYISPITIYAFSWWQLPLFSLLVFLIISAYHFGETQIMSIAKGTPSYGWFYLTWGCLLLSALYYFHPVETLSYLQEIVPLDSIKEVALSTLVVSAIIFSISILYFYLAKQWTTKQLMLLLLDTSMLFVMIWFTDVLFGFAMFFACWHSFDAILLQIKGFRKVESSFGFKEFYRYASIFTLISLSGLALLFYLFFNYDLPINIVMVFFIFISVITLPHMLTIKDFYKNVLSS